MTIAGVTQLITPLVGRLSDSYVPPVPHELGQRLPYLVLGSVATVVGLLGQMMASAAGFWVRYSFAFFLHMIGCKQTWSRYVDLRIVSIQTHVVWLYIPHYSNGQ